MSESVRVIAKYNPATGGLLYEIPFTSDAAIQDAVARAKDAHTAWARLSLKQREKVLRTFFQTLLREADAVARLISQEVGKPLNEAYQTDILTALTGVEHALKRGRHLFRSERRNSLKGLALGRVYTQHRESHGVVALISPWNYPVGTPTAAIAGALLAGNAVVFKPSEKTPMSGDILVRLWQDALLHHGHSPHLVHIVQGDGSVGGLLVNHPDVRFVFFTGSEAVGKRIQVRCAERSIGCSLELGGSDAMVILPSAERYSLDAIVAHAIWGRFTNAGQTCAAIKRLYVPRHLYPFVRELLTAKLLQLRVGDPLKNDTHIGPVIDEPQRAQLEAQLQDAVASSVDVVQASLPIQPAPRQTFMAPALVFDPPLDACVNTEETFGPILPVFAYDDPLQLQRLLNESPYGLGASIFGTPRKAREFARGLQVANVAINDAHMTFYAMPKLGWRGWKASGPGVRMSDEGLLQFVQMKTVGEAPLFGWPFVTKPAWLFSEHGRESQTAKTMVQTFGSGKLRGLMSPRLLAFLWERRSSTRL
jgi:acyl-CoA reductase-like NAD-dependent aldehyde dehydrogenase